MLSSLLLLFAGLCQFLIISQISTVFASAGKGTYLELLGETGANNAFCPFDGEPKACIVLPATGAKEDLSSRPFSTPICSLSKMVSREECFMYCDIQAHHPNPLEHLQYAGYRNGCHRVMWRKTVVNNNTDIGYCLLAIGKPGPGVFKGDTEETDDVMCAVPEAPQMQLTGPDGEPLNHVCKCDNHYEALVRIGACGEPGQPPCSTTPQPSESLAPTTSPPTATHVPSTRTPTRIPTTKPSTATPTKSSSPTKTPTGSKLSISVLPPTSPQVVPINGIAQLVQRGSFHVQEGSLSGVRVRCEVAEIDDDAKFHIQIDSSAVHDVPATVDYTVKYFHGGECNVQSSNVTFRCWDPAFSADIESNFDLLVYWDSVENVCRRKSNDEIVDSILCIKEMMSVRFSVEVQRNAGSAPAFSFTIPGATNTPPLFASVSNPSKIELALGCPRGDYRVMMGDKVLNCTARDEKLECDVPQYGQLCEVPSQGELVAPCGAHTLSVIGTPPGADNASCADCVVYTLPCEGNRLGDSGSGNVFGEADACEPCDSSVTCPGGFLGLPKPGFWSQNQYENRALRCAPPAEKRCQGQNLSAPQANCAGKRTGYLCNTCELGYYPSSRDGECKDCRNLLHAVELDKETFISDVVVPVSSLVLLSGVIVITARLFAGGTWKKGFYRALKFLVWLAYVAQLFAQLELGVHAGSQCAIDSLSFMYPTFAVFQFNGFANVHPTCKSGAYPFTHEIIYFAIVIALCVFSVVLHVLPRAVPSLYMKRKRSKILAKVRQGVMVTLTLLFSATSEYVYSILSCVELGEEDVPVSTVLYLGNRNQTTRRLVARSNHEVECSSDDHMRAAKLAWVTFGVYIIGYPLVTLLYTSIVIPKRENAPSAVRARDKTQCRLLYHDFRAFAHFCWSDFKYSNAKACKRDGKTKQGGASCRRHWFRHIQLAAVGSLAVISLVDRLGYSGASGYTYGTHSERVFRLALMCLIPGLYIVALIYFKPYRARKSWKFPVKVASLVTLLVLTLCAHLIRKCEFADSPPPEVIQQSRRASLVSVCCCCILIIVFFVAFLVALLKGAKKEQFKRVSFRKSLKPCPDSGSAVFFSSSRKSSFTSCTTSGSGESVLNTSTDSQSQLWCAMDRQLRIAKPPAPLSRKENADSTSKQTAVL